MTENHYKLIRGCNATGFPALDITTGKKQCPIKETSIEITHPKGHNLALEDGVGALNQACGGVCPLCGQKATSTSGTAIEDSTLSAFKIAKETGKPAIKIT